MCAGLCNADGVMRDMSDIVSAYERIDRVIRFDLAVKPAFVRKCDKRSRARHDDKSGTKTRKERL